MKTAIVMIEQVTHRKPRAIIGKLDEENKYNNLQAILNGGTINGWSVIIAPEDAIQHIKQMCEVVE